MATDKVNEQEIQFRKRARRRLVGAVVLVLLMVTVLPMILDEHEPKAPQPEIAISIPSQNDTEFTSKVVPEMPSTPAAPAAEPTQAPPGVSGSATVNPAKSKLAIKPATSSGQSETAALPGAKVPKLVTEKNLNSEAKTSAAATQAASADQIPTGSGAYVVQIGVYSDAAKVKQIQAKLVTQGLQSYTERLATPKGMKIRLRVGPYASRAQAEQSRDAIKVAGLDAIVVSSK